jgi:periplasmic divalent cation tolerance protein
MVAFSANACVTGSRPSPGLAACVNQFPGVVSTYRWQGKIHEDAEVLLVIKTTRERFDALRDRLVGLHPYEVPELIALEVADGLPAYLEWVARETATR